MLAAVNPIVEAIHATGDELRQMGFRTWQLLIVVLTLIGAWGWRGAKVPLISFGGKKEEG